MRSDYGFTVASYDREYTTTKSMDFLSAPGFVTLSLQAVGFVPIGFRRFVRLPALLADVPFTQPTGSCIHSEVGTSAGTPAACERAAADCPGLQQLGFAGPRNIQAIVHKCVWECLLEVGTRLRLHGLEESQFESYSKQISFS